MPLFEAAHNSRLAVVQHLLERCGIDPRARSSVRSIPLPTCSRVGVILAFALPLLSRFGVVCREVLMALLCVA
jgi:hypothetical protein